MDIHHLINQATLCDGKVRKITVEYESYSSVEAKASTIEIALNARKCNGSPCVVTLRFESPIEFMFFEDFECGGDYSDITLTRLYNGNYYLSLDPFGNTGEPNDKDNQVIISKTFSASIEDTI